MAERAAEVVIGRYQLFDEIGAGGMASVFLGKQRGSAGFNRAVAIKRVNAELARSPDFVTMFLDEARLAARVRHVNVVSTLDVVRDGAEVLIVMELILGVNLAGLARGDEPLPVGVVSSIVGGVLRGLHAAHTATDPMGVPLDIVHRDVSPHNILVGVDGVARVLDFGVAKANGRLHRTRTGEVRGKLSYMAPEQLCAQATAASDTYSVGVMLWEMLAGRRFRTGNSEGERIQQILNEEVSPLPRLREWPRGLEPLVRRALDPNPALRFPTAEQMADELEAVIPSAPAREVASVVARLGAGRIEELRAAVLATERVPAQPSMEFPMHRAAAQAAPTVREGAPVAALVSVPVSGDPTVRTPHHHAAPLHVRGERLERSDSPQPVMDLTQISAVAHPQQVALARLDVAGPSSLTHSDGFSHVRRMQPAAPSVTTPAYPWTNLAAVNPSRDRDPRPAQPSSRVVWLAIGSVVMAGFHAFAALIALLMLGSVSSLFGLFILLWALAGLPWSAANAYGLFYRTPWSRTSTEAYAATSLFTFFGTPFGIFALLLLHRSDVRAELAGTSAHFPKRI